MLIERTPHPVHRRLIPPLDRHQMDVIIAPRASACAGLPNACSEGCLALARPTKVIALIRRRSPPSTGRAAA